MLNQKFPLRTFIQKLPKLLFRHDVLLVMMQDIVKQQI